MHRPPPPTAMAVDPDLLRAELSELRPRALQRRAEEVGIAEEDLDEADSGEAIVELIVAKVAEEQAAAATAAEGADPKLSAEELDAVSRRPRPPPPHLPRIICSQPRP